MLSFQHPRASCLRVIGDLPHRLFDLLTDGSALTFEPVPEPTVRELAAFNTRNLDQIGGETNPKSPVQPDAVMWARHLGYKVNYDLTADAEAIERTDRKIQIPQFPEELEIRLRQIRASARTAIEESGANMLYLAFGFLEWRDPQTAKAHQAPLVMLPVEIEREPARGGQFRTRVRWTGEEMQPNLSLKKKLEDFNIDLPFLEEDQPLDDYFEQVAEAIRHKPDWTVRRYVTLGLFEFGKILLYLDLAPERWPEDAPIAGNALVREILGRSENFEDSGDDNTAFSCDRDESAQAFEHRDLKLELVDRADSSQCEALEIALAGRNLIIQGPPGTGKSQTITNLVAAALAQGKSVLFVAEKLAALEVVRRRMRDLGLNDFCLELHSHKTRKTEVLEDIAARIRAGEKITPPKDFAGALTRLADRRAKLSAYIDMISRPAAGFQGLVVSDVLMKAGQARRRLGDHVRAVEALREDFHLPSNLDWTGFGDAKGRLRLITAAIDDLNVEGSAFGHVWAGVSSGKVLPYDKAHLADLARQWADRIDTLIATLVDPGLKRLSLEDIESALGSVFDVAQHRPDLLRADEVAQSVERILEVSLPRTPTTAHHLKSLLETASQAPFDVLALRKPEILAEGACDLLRGHQDRIRALAEGQDKLAATFRDSAPSSDPDDLEEWWAALSQRNFFARFGRRWKAAMAGANSVLRPAHLNAKPAVKAQQVQWLRNYVLDLRAVKANSAVEAMVGRPTPVWMCR
ncbi:MAG: hypothetical protein CGW95_07010 [Phenylobacterium zucineum]|nr:MAG: hypothetical protein CGW95_07010 [Phenylobacterium zucineum]